LIFQILPKFWDTHEFTQGAETFTIILIVIMGIVSATILGYLAYTFIARWVRRCREVDLELQQVEEAMACNRAMSEAAVKSFMADFTAYQQQRAQPYRSGSPHSSALNEEIDIEMGRMQDERHSQEMQDSEERKLTLSERRGKLRLRFENFEAACGKPSWSCEDSEGCFCAAMAKEDEDELEQRLGQAEIKMAEQLKIQEGLKEEMEVLENEVEGVRRDLAVLVLNEPSGPLDEADAEE